MPATQPPPKDPLGPLADRHLDRARAESFGAVADPYDRLRPAYPAALMDDLAALHPAEALDVGCGTGKVAVALAERGLPVLGVEPDARMAALARARGIAVEVSTFEGWEDQGRRFELITCGNAWHWIDRSRGIPKLGQVLRPGGAFALFWAVDVLDEAVASTFEPAYRTCAPGLRVFGAPPPAAEIDPFAGVDVFSSVETRVYPAERTLTADGWVSLIATVSDHQRLEPGRLAALQQALRETIEGLGGSVHARCATYLWLARRGELEP